MRKLRKKYNKINLPKGIVDPITLNNFEQGNVAVRYTYINKKGVKRYAFYKYDGFKKYLSSKMPNGIPFLRGFEEMPLNVATRRNVKLNDYDMVMFKKNHEVKTRFSFRNLHDRLTFKKGWKEAYIANKLKELYIGVKIKTEVMPETSWDSIVYIDFTNIDSQRDRLELAFPLLVHCEYLKGLNMSKTNLDRSQNTEFIFKTSNIIETVILNDVNVKEIPKWVYKLNKLKILSIVGNSVEAIKILPVTIKVLMLDGNMFKIFPPVLKKIVNLEALTMSYNQMKEIPESIISLRKLHTLHLDNNDLSSIPRFENMPRLKSLNISDNPRLKKITYPLRRKVVKI
jgi:hypothetical protein